MKNPTYPRLDPDGILRTLDGLQPHAETLLRLNREWLSTAPSGTRAPGSTLATVEFARVHALLRDAGSNCRRASNRSWALLGIAGVSTIGTFILAWIGLRALGWIDASIVQPGSLVAAGISVYTAIAFLVLTGRFLWRCELGRRKAICFEGLCQCRSLLQILDSHLTSKNLCEHWNVGGREQALRPRQTEPRPYHEPEIALEYLGLAGALARVVATIAALYSQAIPTESDVGSTADGVVRHALDLDRNCMMLAALVREGAVSRGCVAIDLPRAANACVRAAPRNPPSDPVHRAAA